MDKINFSNNNILDQIASYSQQEIDELCLTLKKELNAQNKLNDVLKKNNYDENIKSIDNFISRNSGTIDYQYNELTTVVSELKNIINENNSLKDNYNDLIQSDKCVDISNKLKQIKKMKQDIIAFLDKTGI
tara:strand:+ start:3153 stop:3545 length:393 start_codon:yes stop_codon:yes gene_type:complete